MKSVLGEAPRESVETRSITRPAAPGSRHRSSPPLSRATRSSRVGIKSWRFRRYRPLRSGPRALRRQLIAQPHFPDAVRHGQQTAGEDDVEGAPDRLDERLAGDVQGELGAGADAGERELDLAVGGVDAGDHDGAALGK